MEQDEEEAVISSSLRDITLACLENGESVHPSAMILITEGDAQRLGLSNQWAEAQRVMWLGGGWGQAPKSAPLIVGILRTATKLGPLIKNVLIFVVIVAIINFFKN